MTVAIRPRLVPIAKLHPAPWNPRSINDERFKNLCRSIEADAEFLWLRPVLAQADGTIYAGNQRYRAAEHLGHAKIPAIVMDIPEQLAKERALRDNGQWGEWEDDGLISLLVELQAAGSDLDLLGFADRELVAFLASSANGAPAEPPPARITLADRFIVPPFSVLDARQGYWQERKRRWLSIGIQSELGRGATPSTSARVGPDDEATYRPIGGRRGATAAAFSGGSELDAGQPGNLGAAYRARESGNGLLGFSEQARSHYATPGGSPRDAATLGPNGKTVRGDGKGRALATSNSSQERLTALQRAGDSRVGGSASIRGVTWGTTSHPYDGNESPATQSGTSIFDPVLCELAYRWFCPPGGEILDPFAGGSVRGIVAGALGRRYLGIDLSERQIDANREQATAILGDEEPPRWIVGDSTDVETLAPGPYDFVFSCPPYGDLEVYSDDPRDLSVMPWAGFLDAYRAIIVNACAQLRPDRFACFVVGDLRGPDGAYRNFVAETTAAFEAAGLRLWNEAILVTAVGSLPIRAGIPFKSSRKLGKTHQNVLVFVKGDASAAVAACGEVDVASPEEMFGEPLAAT